MFVLKTRSIKKLDGVHPDLVAVCHKAIAITKVDFGIIQGMRTLEEQRRNVANGASQTMNSKHLSGKAVDVAAYQGSVLVWDSAFYPIIAEAFRTASLELMIPIRWGGVWATLRADKTPQEQVKEYVESRKKLGKQSFFDWGHYELA